MADVTHSGGKVTDILSGHLKIDEANDRLIQDDSSDYRLILGSLPDGSIGLVITKPGVDIFDVFG